MTFRGLIFGGNAAIVAVLEVQGRVDRGGLRGMRRTVQGGASIVRGRASGRPGPRVITGDYRRSISGDIIEGGLGRIVGQIGSNAAQARRLEFGFFGPDSLGRRYNQSPYPHFGPSVPDISTLAVREISEGVSQEFAA